MAPVDQNKNPLRLELYASIGTIGPYIAAAVFSSVGAAVLNYTQAEPDSYDIGEAVKSALFGNFILSSGGFILGILVKWIIKCTTEYGDCGYDGQIFTIGVLSAAGVNVMAALLPNILMGQYLLKECGLINNLGLGKAAALYGTGIGVTCSVIAGLALTAKLCLLIDKCLTNQNRGEALVDSTAQDGEREDLECVVRVNISNQDNKKITQRVEGGRPVILVQMSNQPATHFMRFFWPAGSNVPQASFQDGYRPPQTIKNV